jgi:hypothetical protein
MGKRRREDRGLLPDQEQNERNRDAEREGRERKRESLLVSFRAMH